jgi:8-oxo-dGTP diphosphatase
MTIECCADAVIVYKTDTGYKLVLIKRLNEPKGLALPGGRLDPDESLEQCIVREVKEETGLNFNIVEQLKTYSDPNRDPRGQKISTVFLGFASGKFHDGEHGKTEVFLFPIYGLKLDECKQLFAFDHYLILKENWWVIDALIREMLLAEIEH